MNGAEMINRARPIDHASLAQLAEAGSLTETHVVGQEGGWAVVVKYGSHERILSAQRGRSARVFRKMDTLVSYLKEIGISKFDVDAAGHDAGAGAPHARPDRAEALRSAHQAAAHDKWFRAQVHLALDEAESGDVEWVPHDAATQSWAIKREALAAKSGRAQG
jgi:hypothetical protein